MGHGDRAARSVTKAAVSRNASNLEHAEIVVAIGNRGEQVRKRAAADQARKRYRRAQPALGA
ncbi:hypothetical protein QFZ97_006050 [Paraburkholderia youngii]